jgi:hypothetical protein
MNAECIYIKAVYQPYETYIMELASASHEQTRRIGFMLNVELIALSNVWHSNKNTC